MNTPSGSVVTMVLMGPKDCGSPVRNLIPRVLAASLSLNRYPTHEARLG